MAWIKTIDEAEASGTLKQIYDEQRCPGRGCRQYPEDPQPGPRSSAGASRNLSGCHARAGELSRSQREMIALAVSSANGCHY